MMVNPKLLSFAGLGLVSALVLGGCATAEPVGSGDTEDNSGGEAAVEEAGLPDAVNLEGQTVVSLFTSLNNDYYSGWDLGARRAVEAFGGEYVALTNEGDPATQLSQFEQQVDAGVKIFFVTAPDPANVPAMAKIASDNDVCLANTWEQPEWTSPFEMGDGYISYLSPDSVGAGYAVAKALFDEMGGEGNFVHLTGQPGSTPDTQRTAGVDMALAEYPNITLIAREAGKWNRDDARTAMAGIITQYGSEIDGVFGQNDDVGIGAVNALKEAGIEGVPVTGIDGNAGTMELIKNGDMFGAYSSLPWWQAGFSFVQALDACAGLDTHPLNRQLWTSGLFVTQDNVDDYLSTYLGDSDPYDWVKMSKVAHPDDWDPQWGVKTLDIEAMWAHVEKPAGYEPPAEYSGAYGEMEAVNSEWDSHWSLLR